MPNYPDSPIDGEVIALEDGRQFQYKASNKAWEKYGSAISSTTVNIKPSYPQTGSLFFDTVAQQGLEVYDGATSTWIPTSTPVPEATTQTYGTLLGYTSDGDTPETWNTFLGATGTRAINAAFTGTNNTFLGATSAHRFLSTASQNVCVGALSGYRLSTGTYNTFVGYDCGGFINTDYGVVIGASACANVRDFTYGVSIGYRSGIEDTDRLKSTYIGAYSSEGGSGDYTIAIGYKAGRAALSTSSVFIGTCFTATSIVPDGTFVLARPQETDNTIFRINENNAFGIPLTNGDVNVSYGTPGQFLTSQGDTAPPVWTSGASGTFTSNDGKTITVTNGLITSIV